MFGIVDDHMFKNEHNFAQFVIRGRRTILSLGFSTDIKDIEFYLHKQMDSRWLSKEIIEGYKLNSEKEELLRVKFG